MNHVPKWVACSQKVHLTVAYCDAIADRVGRGSMFPRVNVVLRYDSPPIPPGREAMMGDVGGTLFDVAPTSGR